MKKDTNLVNAGRHPDQGYGFVNPPIVRGSTVVFDTLAEFEDAGANKFDKLVYGRFGTPTSKAFEEAIAEIEGGSDSYRTVAVSSGMAAAAVAILAFVKSGDHVLVPDNVYGPVRNLGNIFLDRFGVEMTFYDPIARRRGQGAASRQHGNALSRGARIADDGDARRARHCRRRARARHPDRAGQHLGITIFLPPAGTRHRTSPCSPQPNILYGHSDAMLGPTPCSRLTVAKDKYERLKTTSDILGNCPETGGLLSRPTRAKNHGCPA